MITPRLKGHIETLCNNIPNKEWSGVLFYREEGTFGESDYKIIGEYVLLEDIGQSTYTEYDFSKVPGFLMKNKEFLKMRMGHIHSHNNMDVFFSGTDTSEINSNSEFHKTYLSLIVNNRGDMMAKIAFRVETEEKRTINFINGNESFKNVQKKDKMIMVYNCDVRMMSEKPDQQFLDKMNKMIEEKEAEDNKKWGSSFSYSTHPNRNYNPGYQRSFHWDDDPDVEDEGNSKRYTPITNFAKSHATTSIAKFSTSDYRAYINALINPKLPANDNHGDLRENLVLLEKIIVEEAGKSKKQYYYQDYPVIGDLKHNAIIKYLELYNDPEMNDIGDMIEGTVEFLKGYANQSYNSDIKVLCQEMARILNLVTVEEKL